jgi:hypothetical protein
VSATTGSLKVRRSGNALSVRATGSVAAALSAGLAGMLQMHASGKRAQTLTTVRFRDGGQDFLEWDIDTKGKVVACRPGQAEFWCGSQVTSQPQVGEKLQFYSRLSGKVVSLVHPVESITATLVERA